MAKKKNDNIEETSGRNKRPAKNETGKTTKKAAAKAKKPVKGDDIPKKKTVPEKKEPSKGKKGATSKKTAASASLPGDKKSKAETKKLPAKEVKKIPADTKKSAKKISPDSKEKAGELKKAAKSAVKTGKNILPKKETLINKAKNVLPKVEDIQEAIDKVSKPNLTNLSEPSLFSDYDIHLFKEGKHYHLYKKLGSHLVEYKGKEGVYFGLWAPNAKEVSVIGDFNEWSKGKDKMKAREDHSGIWEIFIPEAKKGSIYKYYIESNNGYLVEKGDPYAFMWETPPRTASIVWDLENDWNDGKWMKERKQKAGKPKPYSVYEIHLGSWRRVPEEDNRSLTYKELAQQLPAYMKETGFTHVEFMPVMEHPFFGSWGYQVTGYFAPSSRFGTPQDFMQLIDTLHQEGIGVILDWVPSHFPNDMHGLHYFDGTFLYEHENPNKGYHPDWKSYIFNYGRSEIKSFLISNALFWLEKFHADGLRVDAVASMLYLDYSRKEGEWEPNVEGGRENLEAISFLKEFNEVVYSQFPDVDTIAEESTSFPMVSRPTYAGGLGFGQKWMMGWMHDTLEYFKMDPIHRKHHQDTITFSTNYAFSENFLLPLSHDEVVYGKQSLLYKMPGDDWNKFANLRTLYAYMFAHPGTKLLFMGGEFGQTSEWSHDHSLDWHLTEYEYHRKLKDAVKRINEIYKSENAFFDFSFDEAGFSWVDINDHENSVVSFVRKGKNSKDRILVVCNFTPVPRENYRIGVPNVGQWKEIFNSDAEEFGGSNVINASPLKASSIAAHGFENSVSPTLPPLGVIYLKLQ